MLPIGVNNHDNLGLLFRNDNDDDGDDDNDTDDNNIDNNN